MAQSITIKLDDEIHKKLKITATEEGKTIQNFVENLIKEKLVKKGKI